MSCPYCKREEGHDHLFLEKNGKRISDDDFETRNGKASPFGWSYSEIWHKDGVVETMVGTINCGSPEINKQAESLGYKFVTEKIL